MEDFDDTQLAVAKDRVYGLLTHPTVTVLPAVLGLAEMAHLNGKDTLLAYHLGVEVECKLAEATSPRSYGEGFHSTGVFGVIGSAVGCAKLKGFDLHRTMRTIAIAATHAGGLRENFGTLCKPLQAGQGAEGGVVAAELAALGWDGAESILEANNGFSHAYGGSYDPDALMGKLGALWTFANPGVSIKPHPSGSLTHPGMTEILRLIRTKGIKPANVEKVDVGANSMNVSTLIHHQPKTGLQAKFSMEYCIAVCLVHSKAGLAEFTGESVNQPEVQDMVRRVHFYVDPVAEKARFSKITTIINVHLKDGQMITGEADFGKGSPSNPMNFDDVAGKLRGCAAFVGWPKDKTDRLIDRVAHFDELRDVEEIAQLCRG